MKTRNLVCILVGSVFFPSLALAELPFPEMDGVETDPEIVELVAYRIEGNDLSEGYETHIKIVAMGAKAVPTLIALSKRAANVDPRVLGQEQDFGFELRRPIEMLVEIGDRRAIPLVSALVKYDTKPRRMHDYLAKLLCRGTDEQIEGYSKSKDPNVARVAKQVDLKKMREALSKETARRIRFESNVDPFATVEEIERGGAGIVGDPFTTVEEIEQDGADQPATAPKSKAEGNEKAKPESEVRPR